MESLASDCSLICLRIVASILLRLGLPDAIPDLLLMQRIDELHLNYPFAGSRMLRDLLRHQSLVAGRRHIKP